jgi:lipopolysaccharide heptosyltransferase I
MEQFLIIRLSSLGDIIHTLPAFAALRKNFPKAKITWVVESKGKEILDWVPGIDGVIVVGSPGWRKKIRDKNQTAIDFQGLVKSGFIARFSQAEKRTGFQRTNLKEPLAALFYTDLLKEVSEADHVIGKNLKLLELVGVKEDRYEFPLAIPEDIRNSVREKTRGLGYKGEKKLILFNVGAAWPTKRWYPENWVSVLNRLQNETAFPILLWGTDSERELAEAVGRQTGVPLVPFLSVKEILALIKDTALVVSGDTFALQAACALSVPVVGIFGPTNPTRNGPFSAKDKTAYHEIACSRCYQRTCGSMKCLKIISPDEVAALIRQSLQENV